MCITLRPAVKALGKEPEKNLCTLAQLVAGQTTLNAQGNSGTIFSFVFSRLNAAIQQKGKGSLSVSEFVQCLDSLAKQMNQAMEQPVPGTLLSVIADAFDGSKLSAVKNVGDLVQRQHLGADSIHGDDE